MNREETLKRRIAAVSFSMWELHLFLDTHPNNCEAAKKLQEYEKKYNELKEEYEEKFGPLNETAMSTSRWAWISDPWPWESED